MDPTSRLRGSPRPGEWAPSSLPRANSWAIRELRKKGLGFTRGQLAQSGAVHRAAQRRPASLSRRPGAAPAVGAVPHASTRPCRLCALGSPGRGRQIQYNPSRRQTIRKGFWNWIPNLCEDSMDPAAGDEWHDSRKRFHGDHSHPHSWSLG